MTLRNILFQIHLWIGLGLGLFLILLGLSGSYLVYPDLFGGGAPPVPKATAAGQARPLEEIIDAARQAAPTARGNANVTLPRQAGDAIGVQFVAGRGGFGEGRRGGGRRGRGGEGQNTQGPRERGEAGLAPGGEGRRGEGGRGAGGRGPGGISPTIYVDPVSATVIETRMPGRGGLGGTIHQLHEAMLLGGFGRGFVAWLGVGMFFLGLSGLYMWWPKANHWRQAFFVRSTAKGARWWRELHTTFGVWFWIVFIVVTATSIPLGFPAVMTLISGAPNQGPPQAPVTPQIEAPEGATRMPLDQVVSKVRQATGSAVNSISVPAAPNRPITVTLAGGGPRPVAVNPYTAELLAPPAAAPASGINRRTIESLHGGEGLGPVWKFLVFLSGFLPLIFVSSGFLMWLKKRQARATGPTRT